MSAIRTANPTTGVYWVEVPDADLRILCGCPADSIKHLMKRGFVVPKQSGSVLFETGPNAILLSDVSVQNGSFANLAEFPVLQMLYRQGMILPRHPGNTGVKPLLIGHRDQLDAQVSYIHRGNYGLLNESEIVAAGVSPDAARDMIRIKLKFAFGKIADSGALLDRVVVGSGPVEIRNGVTIRRKAINVFEFAYGGEAATIDLNLGPNVRYVAPYSLGRFQIEREYFSVVHSGEGDGWDIDRPSMGSVLTFQGKIYLIDAGPNIEAILQALGIDVSEIEGIFQTHSHDDHFAGLPSLIRSDHRLKFFSTKLVRSATAKKLAALMAIDQSHFERYFSVCDLDLDVWNNVDGLEVRPVYSPHPVETTAFLFRALWGQGYRTYAHLADITAFDVMEGMVTDDPQAPGMSRAYCDEVKAFYRTSVDVKKIDIGGGLIHGKAEDFAEDASGKLVLAHVARPLTETECEIGSGAPFGTDDVLIASNHEFLFGRAFGLLSAYFPSLPHHQFRLLLNHPVVRFNPEEIILKEREVSQFAYFILTGAVEMLESASKRRFRLSSGCFIGELSGLYDLPSAETYRAISFVKALKLPIDLYSRFVEGNNLFATIAKLAENRELLRKSWLFGEAISDGIQNTIAAEMEIVRGSPLIRDFPNRLNCIALIKEGEVTLQLGAETFETLGPGDVFFEDHAVYGMESVFKYDIGDPAAVAFIPVDVIRDVPIVQWKLLETINRRMRTLADFGRWDDSLLQWRSEYGVGLDMIDEHHRQLLDLTALTVEALKHERGATQLKAVAQQLIDYTDFHFAAEEALFFDRGYSEAEMHRAKHEQLKQQLSEIVPRLDEVVEPAGRDEITAFLKRWVVAHILLEDRKYAAFLART